LTTFPDSEKTRVPVEVSTPSFAYASPPSSSTAVAVVIDSTLLTAVGAA
jgi:hypothetical protein